jgi:hypothetical protein
MVALAPFIRSAFAFEELGDAAGATRRSLNQVCPQLMFPGA